MDDKELKKLNMLDTPSGETVQEVNTDFMKEEFKKRPVSRKKLFRSTLMTILLAALFGAVACAVFLLLEPVISNKIYPQEEEEVQISLADEVKTEEMSPSDMIESDDEIAEQKTDEIKQEILGDLADQKTGLEDYTEQYQALVEMTQEASRSMVKVEGISSDYDWTGNAFEDTGSTSGVIFADTQNELLILAQSENVVRAQKIRITMNDGSVCSASIRSEDPLLKMVVLSVEKSKLSQKALADAVPIKMIGSMDENPVGEPVAAIGMPAGIAGSMISGHITSDASLLDISDCAYKLITTDIYASMKGTGVLIDMSGRMIGLIDMSYHRADMPNSLCCISVAELKSVITAMSNRISLSYLGIHGSDVPEDIRQQMNIPEGMYVLQTDLDSPAMNAGIQSGDIICQIMGIQVNSYKDYINALNEIPADKTVTVVVKRRGAGGYGEIALHITTKTRLITSEE